MITVPPLMTDRIQHALDVIKDFGGGAFFCESGVHVMRVSRQADAVLVQFADRSTPAGRAILADANRTLATK